MTWVAFFGIVALAAWLEEADTRRAEMVVSAVLLLAVLAFLYTVGEP